MIKRIAFHIDTSSCSGCKACQVVCKDKNVLEPGQLFRRVYEIQGGGWVRQGTVWKPNLSVYNISLACNHCERPQCKEVCPTGAIQQREDGVVFIEASKCIGCRYCEWACPYGAPQFSEEHGVMGKCNACVERVDQGLQPLCVASCPMRALDFGELEELRAHYGILSEISPLPEASLTGPALVITPHQTAMLGSNKPLQIKNKEEV